MSTTVANPALESIRDVINTHVELSPEEASAIDKKLPNIIAIAKVEVRKELEAEYIEKSSDFQKKLEEENRKLITSELEKYKASLEPLTKDEISDLLNQEYTDFAFPVKQEDGQIRNFTIRELPQAVENRFLTKLQEKLVPVLQNVISIDWSLDGTMVDKIKNTLDALPGLLTVATQCCMISLDPYGKENITESWVANNLSTYRISLVLIAQVEANKYRDFFSNGFRLSKATKPMTR